MNENQANETSFDNVTSDNPKKCKCGALDHTKTNHMACSLNKKYNKSNKTLLF